MKRYTVHYMEDDQHQTWNCRAYDKGHAEEKFWEMLDRHGGPEGIGILEVTRRRTQH